MSRAVSHEMRGMVVACRVSPALGPPFSEPSACQTALRRRVYNPQRLSRQRDSSDLCTILVVDDAPEVRELVTQACTKTEWIVEFLPNLAAATAVIERGRGDLLITGLTTTSSEDVATLRDLRCVHPALRMIVLTQEQGPESALTALRGHAFSYFAAPFSADGLQQAVEHALAERHWEDGLELLSDSPTWITVRAKCRRLTADRLLRFVEELSVDLSEVERTSTATAFREILLNAMEHGGEFQPDRSVEITRIKTPTMIMYLVRDPGEGFDFAELPHAAISSPDDPVRHVLHRAAQGMRAGGFGLLLAQGLVDEMLHNAQGNEAILVKYLK
jgi:anti-sigma regulatory factor (Ser/Thr protein kinase)/CheY-like chemotaxis protein